jgi:hypothetical protein
LKAGLKGGFKGSQMEALADYLPYILNGAGGAVLAPLIAGLLGGRGLGGVVNIILGAAAGVSAGFGTAQLGYANLLGGSENAAMGYVQDLLEGGIGGGVLGLLLSFIRK